MTLSRHTTTRITPVEYSQLIDGKDLKVIEADVRLYCIFEGKPLYFKFSEIIS